MPNPDPLATYARRFTRLKAARRDGEAAPYKPALLLAVIAGIEEGWLTNNRITFSPELIATFRAACDALNASAFFRANQLGLPFYHLSKEVAPFWFLRTHRGLPVAESSSHSLISFKNLRETVEYAYLAPDLWALLLEAPAREVLRQTLLDHYFPATRHRYRPTAGLDELARIRRQMLEEPAAVYADHARATAADDEDVAVRSGVFKRVVLEAYQYTCAISGLQLTSTAAASSPLLDACHIVPWAASYDDTLPNGFALCPNLHRAFDRHLFWIDDEYRVRCADSFQEAGNLTYGIRQFEGKPLRLPRQRAHWPHPENFRRQREA